MKEFSEKVRRLLRKAETSLGLIKSASLPVPFYKVLAEELKLVRPESTAQSADVSGNSDWTITNDQVTDWQGLRARWDLLRLERLVLEVQERGAHRLRGYIQELAESFSQAAPKVAKPAFARLENLVANKVSDTALFRAEAEPKTEENLLKKMGDLIKAEKCLCRYEMFPHAQLSKSMWKLANSFRKEDTHGQREELNRLVLEDLFPDQVQRAYSLRLQEVRKRMSEAKLSALCLSGGGIRSATFCLGILQGLANKGVLQEFDFLSTVSGGGYIGSWLSSWLHHNGVNRAQVFDELNRKEPDSRFPVEPKEIVHLRKYSNYLTPRLGFLSADTWVLIGTYLRNLLLNWIVFGPFLLAACAVPRLCVAFLRRPPTAGLMNVFLCGGLLLAILGLAYASAAHPGAEGQGSGVKEQSAESKKNNDRRYGKQAKEFIRLHGQSSFFWFCLAPIYLSATLLTTFWVWLYTPGTPKSGLILSSQKEDPQALNYVVVAMLATSLGWLVAQIWVILRTKAIARPYPPGVEIGTGLVAGLLFYLAAHLALPLVRDGITSKEVLLPYASFAVPLVLLIFLVAGTVFVGLGNRWSSDEDREWWARMGAWILVLAVSWASLCAWILFGPLLFYKARAFLGSIGGLSGLVTLVLAHSGLTAANPKGEEKTGRGGVWAKYSLVLAAPVFLASIVAGLSMIVGWLMYSLASAEVSATSLYRLLVGGTTFAGIQPLSADGYLAIIEGTLRHLAFNFILLMLALGLVASLLVNINRFSLHAVYRNRLVRAYLGATNPKRNPNLFTGFDPQDNLALAELRSDGGAGPTQRPLHIINMALNLVGGKELAWQQRKAESFTASKLYVGNFRLGFRSTRDYASSQQRGGLTLGTAMAISGAAANPNMGYHSSPVVAFLMTLFNVRLGCWLGNPGPAGQDSYQASAPAMPVWFAAKEAFGLSDDASGFVCLSDGGHFENLGLYEMIQRRCETIVVCDAGCDPSCSLEDLGNAIRKIRADLGVRIELQNFNIYSRDDKRYENSDQPEIGRYCALGDIYYDPESDDPQGTLIYIKPAICGKEPKDVFNYKQVNRTFPHESTADQFFSESQFESYRALGVWVIQRIYEVKPRAGETPPSTVPSQLDDFTRLSGDYSRSDDGESIGVTPSKL